MTDLLTVLRSHFTVRPDVYVSGNQFLYYREGDPRAVVAPDIYVVTGTHKEERRTYKLWEEGRPPVMILELTSDSTRDEDLHKKKDCYERIGVEEYFLFDPLGDYLRPPLQGFRLENGRYRPLNPAEDGSLESRTLGLGLRREGDRLRLVDSATGEPLLRMEELQARLRQELERSRNTE